MSSSKPQTREPLNSRQKSILISFYAQNPYPSATERHQLVKMTGRTMKQIQDWFSNRRRVDPELLHGKTKVIPTPLPPPPQQQQPSVIVQSNYPYYPEYHHYSTSMSMCPCYQCHCSYPSVMVEPSTYCPDALFYSSSLINFPQY